MSINIDIINECEQSLKKPVPSEEMIKKWVLHVVKGTDIPQDATVCIRLVNEQESAQLNFKWRNKKGPTNIMAFSGNLNDGNPIKLLGDLIVCASVVERESQEQNKASDAHWAHIIIHGLLHLMGYDHFTEKEAFVMESLETKLLHQLGYPAPYDDKKISELKL